jgi:hypothetical protein
VGSSQNEVVPHINIRSPRLRPEKFVIGEAKRLLQHYRHVEDVALPFAGRWHMRIEAETPFQKITLEDDFDVPAN